jgi:ribosomal protein S18 acetylase RimI-like enzyme
MPPRFRYLTRSQWSLLRDTRLNALKDSPNAFLATYDKEDGYDQEQWKGEFDRGKWIIGEIAGKPVCLMGITREPNTPLTECYLEYVWVAPDHRRSGFASYMLEYVLGDLKASGIRTVFLWVLDDNDAALLLYKERDFVSTNGLQPLEADPARSERQFRRDLT